VPDVYDVDYCQSRSDFDKSFLVSHYLEYLTFAEQGIVVGIGGSRGFSRPCALCSLLNQLIPSYYITPF
jgi:hypothetical protein